MVQAANKTARAAGAVGKRAVVPAYVATTSRKDEYILDYGSGPLAAHTASLREQGFTNVFAHDFGKNKSELLSSDALTRKYDTVFASNVLNVQGSAEMLARTLNEIARCVKPTGRFVANLPASPRYGAWEGGVADYARLLEALSQRFGEVKHVSGPRGAPVIEARDPRRATLAVPPTSAAVKEMVEELLDNTLDPRF